MPSLLSVPMSYPFDHFVILATVATVAITLYLVFRRSWASDGKRRRYAPVAGTLFHQLLHFRNYHDYLTGISQRHKTFRLVGLTHDEIFTVDPANIEYILKTNFSNFGKGWICEEAMEDLLGDGIFAVDGAKWRHQRKLASFEFSTKVLRDFSTVVFKKNAARLANIVAEASDNQKVMEMQDLFMKSTMDSIFKVAFGVELNCLSGTNKAGARFARAFDEASVLITWRFVNSFWKIGRFFGVGSEAALKQHIKVVDNFVNNVISAKRSQMSNAQNANVQREDILSRFLVQSDDDPKNLNQKYLRDIILNFVIAGKDTTAGTLSWFLYMLCKNPSVQEKLALEVREAIQSDNSIDFEKFALCLSDDILNKLHYLHASLTETLRLYPAVPSDSKVCFSDDTLPDGFSVRKGDVFTYSPYPMGRMRFIWGEDAEIFRPERWLDASGVFQPESPFKFTAFQAGPRICLGKEFAYRQMKVFGAVLLNFFRFELGDENEEVTYKTMLTLYIEGGLHVRAFRR